MKGLPYFRWYPADAATDENYAALNDQQLGFFHRCLNQSWINGGLPADLDKLASTMHVTRAYVDRMWTKVGPCFHVSADGSRLLNRRQEEEREHAVTISEKNRRPGNTNASKENANANRTRLKRDPIGPQHAHARADSAYESESSGFETSETGKPNTGIRGVPNVRQFRNVLDNTVTIPPEYEGFDWEGWVRTRWSAHPIPGKGAQFCVALVLERVFQPAPDGFLPSEFEVSHNAWIEAWKRGDSTPCSLEVFIVGGWFNKMPPARASPAGNSVMDRRLTATQEAMERAKQRDREAGRC